MAPETPPEASPSLPHHTSIITDPKRDKEVRGMRQMMLLLPLLIWLYSAKWKLQLTIHFVRWSFASVVNRYVRGQSACSSPSIEVLIWEDAFGESEMQRNIRWCPMSHTAYGRDLQINHKPKNEGGAWTKPRRFGVAEAIAGDGRTQQRAQLKRATLSTKNARRQLRNQRRGGERSFWKWPRLRSMPSSYEKTKARRRREAFIASYDNIWVFGSQIRGNVWLGWHRTDNQYNNQPTCRLKPMQFFCFSASANATNLGLRRKWPRRRSQSRIVWVVWFRGVERIQVNRLQTSKKSIMTTQQWHL
jgi:hypothetical protein